MWSDEKQFVLNGAVNKQNDRIYAKSREEANLNGGLVGRMKHPISIMAWAGLTIHGPILYFIEPGERLNGTNYSRLILSFAKKRGNKIFDGTDWVFQQDGAPAHTSKVAQRWCFNNLKYFLPKDQWPLIHQT